MVARKAKSSEKGQDLNTEQKNAELEGNGRLSCLRVSSFCLIKLTRCHSVVVNVFPIPQDLVSDIIESLATVLTCIQRAYEKSTWVEIWEFIKLRFPPIAWLPEYTFEKFRLDLTVENALQLCLKICMTCFFRQDW
jgi:hypothetical protein